MRNVILFLAVASLVGLSGCLGGEARSEWAYNITQLDEARGDGKTGAGIIIAVLDTGINVGHPAMSHLVDGKADNGELKAFKDFLGSKSGVDAAFDDDGHGTHVVGIMAARGSSFGDKLVNGGVDLKGGSPNAQYVVARVCDTEQCDPDKIDDAIRWARDNRAQIISLSLGGERAVNIFNPIFNTDPIDQAINNAINSGIVVVASAGNSADEADDVAYPANLPGVIAVGSIDRNGEVSGFSNRGDSGENRCNNGPLISTGRCRPNQKPEVVAPGEAILSAWTKSNYVRATGTSQATPFVTSTVALMLEDKPRLSGASDVRAVKSVLMNTAMPIEGQTTPHDNAAGYGIVQAAAAVKAYAG